MPAADFQQVTTWVFDLDNTLYPPEARLFDQIEVRMTGWVMDRLGLPRDQADALRAAYWASHGTTLAGLMHHHAIDPGDFLAHVHDIDLATVAPDPALTAALRALPGRRIVHTNADTVYAARVLQARGLSGLFDALYGVEETGFQPKPRAGAYAAVIAQDGFDPARAAMFEDDARNLLVPHGLGMRTVLVASLALVPGPDHVHHQTADLAGFLRALMRAA